MHPWYSEAASSPEFMTFVFGLAFFFGILIGLGARRFPLLTPGFFGGVVSALWWAVLQNGAKAVLSIVVAGILLCVVPPYMGAVVGQALKRRLNWV